MHIFQQEYDDGLAETIRSAASISYASIAEPCHNEKALSKIKHIKSIAAMEDSDLYYVQSILVSSSWNKNDDIFDKSEVWLARNTPEDKPTNLEHDENLIIGHITSNWPITEDGILIDENTPIDNLPEKYHILTGSVIYKAFSSPDLRDRSEKLIAEIESGQKYVSMECFFKGFDYGVIDKTNGNYKILARDNDTAYLTKYLKAYGGAGEHENYKIGRVLRNITFSGKGYVNKPANPDSVIFTKQNIPVLSKNIAEEKSANLPIMGVSDNQSIPNTEKENMSDLEPVQKDVAELKAKVEAMQGCSEIVKEAYAAASSLKEHNTELENTIKTHLSTIADVQSTIEAANLEKEEAAKKMTEDMKKKDEEMQKMKAELDTALETIAAYKNKEAEMMKKEKKMKRMASLIELGIDNEAATATVDKFENLDDETFEAMTSLVAAKMPPWLKKEDKKKEEEAMIPRMKKKASEETSVEADPAVLETVEVNNDVNLSVGGDEEESALESTRAALIEFVESRLGKKL